MSITLSTNASQKTIYSIKPNWFLLIGALTMTASHMTYNVDFVGWFSIVPFLIYLHLTKGWKSRLYFTLTLILTWSLIVYKIISAPIPFGLAFMYSIPISLIHLPGYLIWQKFKDQHYSIFLFPALMTVLEWLQYTFTPLASWGAISYTQLESIDIIQLVSIFGMAGLSFLIYWVNVSIAEYLMRKKRSLLNFYLPLLIYISAIIWGGIRYDLHSSKGVETIKIAAVGTDSKIGGLPLPTQEKKPKRHSGYI